MREACRIGVALVLESRAGVAEEYPIRRAQQAVPKRPRSFASQGEPSPKKARKGSEAEASARILEVIPPSAKD